MENNLLRYVQFPPGSNTCGRCRERNAVTTMSFFDEQMLCLDCREDETFAPNYAAARAAERQAVKSGNQRFPGVGLTDEDRAVLDARLIVRRRGPAEKQPESRPRPGSTWRARPGDDRPAWRAEW